MKINIINKSYNSKAILTNISTELHLGDVVYISGENGAGKTTLLNIISGIDNNYSGKISYNFQPKISYMFQDAALLPWLNVKNNIYLGRDRNYTHNIENLVEQISNKLKISKYLKYQSSTLSGGLQKRVSLARALIKVPNILVLDEPFANLDQESKEIIMELLSEIKERKNTLIIITEHNRSLIEKLIDKEIRLG